METVVDHVQPNFALFLESADIANLISSLVNAVGYCITPISVGNGKCAAAAISSSVGSTNSAASAIVSGTVFSFGPFGRNSLNLSTALTQYSS